MDTLHLILLVMILFNLSGLSSHNMHERIHCLGGNAQRTRSRIPFTHNP